MKRVPLLPKPRIGAGLPIGRIESIEALMQPSRKALVLSKEAEKSATSISPEPIISL